MSETVQKEQYEFKAEVNKLLSIITHSIYTQREIFLRELISNASDALDRLRFEQARGAEIANPDIAQEILISTDKDGGKLVVEDTGLGMTHEELVENIGTIAHSGSEEFVKKMAEAAKEGDEHASAALIGRFGVGFYSVFMVADKVELFTRSAKAGEQPWLWRSDGSGSFEIEPLAEDKAPARGTRIEITLKEDAKEFAEDYRVQDIIKRHSTFISFPIVVDGTKVNTIPALWREPKFQIKPEQYEEFYKFQSMDHEGPMETIHVSVDAPVQFTSLAFIPKRGRDYGMKREQWGLDLYVRRVLIQRENIDTLPEYLSFLKGVVDTEDLPLNLSRETLQENLVLRKIQQTLTKQVLTHLERMAMDRPDEYKEFWNAHGATFKFGYSDFANRERIAGLLRFNSSIHEDKEGLTSLEEYVGRMKADQKEIYYAAGVSREAIRLNPHLEIFRKKGLEVLYLLEPVDEFALEGMNKFKDHELKSVEHAAADELDKLPDAEDSAPKAEKLGEEERKSLDDLLGKIKTILGERVTDVKISQRLSDSPACLVNPDGAMSSSMEKLMKVMSKDMTPPRKILEINPDHPLVRNLLKVYRADQDDAFLATSVEQLYESSLLLEGYLADPHALVERINKLLEQSSGWYRDIKGL